MPLVEHQGDIGVAQQPHYVGAVQHAGSNLCLAAREEFINAFFVVGFGGFGATEHGRRATCRMGSLGCGGWRCAVLLPLLPLLLLGVRTQCALKVLRRSGLA